MASISSMKPMAPPLVPGGLAQRLEVVADLAGRRAVEHGLEAGCRHEQEWHPRLAGHRLSQVGLAGAWRALEQQAAARRAPHLGGKGLVRQEQIQRADDVLFDLVDAPDIVEGYVNLLRAEHQVRGTARPDRGRGEHQPEQQEEQERHEGERVEVGHVRAERVTGQPQQQQQQHRAAHNQPDPGQPAAALPFPGDAHVRAPRPENAEPADQRARVRLGRARGDFVLRSAQVALPGRRC